MLGEGPIFGINGNFDQKKNLVLILVKQTKNFAWVCIIMLITICLLMEMKSLSLKPTIKVLTFQINYVWEARSTLLNKWCLLYYWDLVAV